MEPYWHKPNTEVVSIFVQRIKNNNAQRNSDVQQSWNTLIRGAPYKTWGSHNSVHKNSSVLECDAVPVS